MEYRENPPSAPLASFVECVWTLESNATDPPGEAQPVLPDGRPELILHLGDRFERLHPDGSTERQPSLIFAGQLTGPLQLRPTGRVAVLGVRFRPDAAAAMTNVPQHELVDITVGVEAVSAALARSLRRVTEATDSVVEAARLVQEQLGRHINPMRLDGRVRGAVSIIGHRRGCVSIDRLAGHLGLTRRHLERRFKETVGLSPKRLARVVRFQHAVRTLEHIDSARPGTLTAAECGYADQAHFIRDFRELAGCPPGVHLLRGAELTGLFTDRQVAK